MKKTKFSKILSLIIAVALMVSVLPVNIAMADDTKYYMIVSADKESAAVNDTVTVSVTLQGNGIKLENVNIIQFDLNFAYSSFAEIKNASSFDQDWLKPIKDDKTAAEDSYGEEGKNTIGYIKTPTLNAIPSGQGEGVRYGLIDVDEGRYITSDHALASADSTVVAKINLKALKAIDDISAELTIAGIKVGINGFATAQPTEAVQMSQLTAAKAIDFRITSLPSPVTYDDKKDVENIRKDYEALSPAFLKDYVTKLGVLSLAEGVIGQRETAIAEVIAKIEDIGKVDLNSEAKINDAKSAYNALLTDSEKAAVTNYTDLTKAEADYNTLLNNKQAADDVVELINKIPTEITKDNLESAKSAIDSARLSYDALVAEGIESLVPANDLAKLTDAENLYVEVKADVKAAEDFDDLVENLGPITLESEEAISNAEAEYEKLSDRAKSYTTKRAELEQARNQYNVLYEDEQAVLDVIGIIEALGEAEDITLDDKEAIEEAEKAYDGLREDLKLRVTNKENLDAVRARYNELEESKKRVDNVISLIGKIDSPVTLSSKAAIDAARSAYDLLDALEQESVTNYEVLTDAEAEYARLKEEADQELLDRENALGVDNIIDALGEITLDSKDAIDAAYAAYNSLTEQAKGFVTKKDALDEAKAIYDALVADDEAVKAVIKAIDDIDVVEYTEESYAKIVLAESMYNGLEERLKGKVTNYDDIQAAYDRYAALEEDEKAVQNVIGKIDEIGEVVYTTECKEKIDLARAVYEDLRDDLEGRITNYQLLLDAEALYDELLPKGNATEDAVEAYGNMYVTVFNTIPDGKVVTVDGKVASVVKKSDNGDEKIYYVILSSEKLDMTNVTVSDGVSQTQTIGDVLNYGDGIWGDDASLVNKKAATMTAQDFDKLAVFDNDPFAYIRADVNGDGEIGAVDALIIARIAAGDDMATKLIIGN